MIGVAQWNHRKESHSSKFQMEEARADRGHLCLGGSVFYCNSVMSSGVITVQSKTIKINEAMISGLMIFRVCDCVPLCGSLVSDSKLSLWIGL